MNRKRAILILMLGLFSGLVAVVGTSNHLSKPRTTTQAQPAKRLPVVILKNDVEQGIKLRRQDLEVAQWPEAMVHPFAVRSVPEAANRVALVHLVKGEPLLKSKLAPADSPEGLAALIPPGMRGIAVRVNNVIGVAGFLLPKSRVDVLTTMDLADGNGARKSITKVILKNIEVLEVGDRGSRTNKGKGNGGAAASVVTLLVDPEQAERLTLASNKGSIHLALRTRTDTADRKTPGVTPNELIFGDTRNGHAAPKPAPKPALKVRQVVAKPPEPEPVRPDKIEVIRGGKLTVEQWLDQKKVVRGKGAQRESDHKGKGSTKGSS